MLLMRKMTTRSPEGRKVVIMTFQELMDLVEIEENMKLPSAFAVRKDMEDIILRKLVCDDTEIRIYRRGYVFYRQGRHMTVYSLEKLSPEYSYDSAMGVATDVSSACCNADCVIRLILEGEDRISRNIDTIEQRHKVSYSAVSEEWDAIRDQRNYMDEVIDSMLVEQLLEHVTDRQRELLKKHFFEEFEMVEISKAEGKSRQAVSDAIRKAIKKMQHEVNE